MRNADFIEKIIIGNDYHKQYPSFDAFWDAQIANSFVVCDGPAPLPKPEAVELAIHDANKAAAKAALEPKYWAVERAE